TPLFQTAAGRIRALTAAHRITPTSPRCQSAWQPNHGRRSTYRRGKSVQTTGTTSDAGRGKPTVKLASAGFSRTIKERDGTSAHFGYRVSVGRRRKKIRREPPINGRRGCLGPATPLCRSDRWRARV